MVNNSMEYNTQKEDLRIKEYGRHVQDMVAFLVNIQDNEERQKTADAIIKLMAQMHPHLKSENNYMQKLWTHLFIMANFNLDVKCPYEIKAEVIEAKPALIPYPRKKIRFKHYGKGVENMLAKAVLMEDIEKRDEYLIIIGSYMKLACKNWNNEILTDAAIRRNIRLLTSDKIVLDEDFSFDVNSKQMKRLNTNNRHKNNNNNRNKNNRNNNNRNNNNRNNNNRNRRK